MSYIKIILLSLILSIVGSAAYVVYTSQTSYQLDKAVSHFGGKNFNEALRILEEIKTELPPSRWLLYRSYISRAQGILCKANEQLEKALSSYQKTLQPSDDHVDNNELLLKEIQLNQILNAYSEFKIDAFSQHIDKALKTIGTHDFYLSYFAGLKCFYHHHFQEALDIWESLPEKQPSSKWIEIAFDEIITPRKLSYQSLQCHIELGHLNYLRELIENNSKFHDILHPFESSFLRGLAYSKLAENSSVEIALAYYKQADAFFNDNAKELSLHECEKNRLCKLYKEMILDILQKNSTEMIGVLANRLEEWNAHTEIQEIAESCIAHLDHRSQTFSESLLHQLPANAYLKRAIFTSYENKLIAALKNHQIAAANELWDKAVFWSNDLEVFTQRTAAICQEQILALIENDDNHLSNTLPYMLFLQEICKNIVQSPNVCEQLVYLSGSLWINYGQPQKAFNLMLIAEELAAFNHRDAIIEAIHHELEIVAAYAKHYNFFDMLCLIHQAVSHFHITTIELERPGELANQIADCMFLFDQKRYNEVEQRAKWALCMDPNNSTALKLLGLANYQLKKYDEAITNLQKIPSVNLQILEIIGICLIQSGNMTEGQDMLKTLALRQKLSDESFYHLGKLEDDPQRALKWLTEIKSPNEEVYARLFIAFYSLKNWHSAVQYYHKLSPPYSKLHSLQLMAVECFIALNEREYAEVLLKTMQIDESIEQRFPGPTLECPVLMPNVSQA